MYGYKKRGKKRKPGMKKEEEATWTKLKFDHRMEDGRKKEKKTGKEALKAELFFFELEKKREREVGIRKKGGEIKPVV